MATIQNDIDILLQAESPRVLTTIQEQLALGATSNTFTVSNTGTPTPSVIQFTALPISIPGNVTWSCTGGTLSSISGNSASLQYTDMSGTTATVTAQITDAAGTHFTASQVITNNLPNSNATIYAYQRSATTLTSNPGAVTYTFAAAAITTPTPPTLANGWTTTIPSGTTPLWTTIAVASGNLPTCSVLASAWSTPQQLGTTGPTGSTGTSGQQSAYATVYQWASSIPAGPSGSPTYTWATSSFGAAPSPWSLTPGTSGPAGYTLWSASVHLTDVATNTTTNFSWSSASISAVGGSGAVGSTGATGNTGDSYRLAYNAVNGGIGAENSTPTTYTTSGSSSFPPINTWGSNETITWQGTVPSISTGQSLYQIDGVYAVSTGNTVWGVPYLSSLKVGSLSAISANLGTVTAGTIIGTLIETATSGQRITINESSNNTINAYNSSGSLEAQFGSPAGDGYMWANSGSISVPGVSGSCSASGGIGVQGQATGANCIAVYAQVTGANGSAVTGTGGLYAGSFLNHGGNALNIDGAIVMTASGGPLETTNAFPITDNTYTCGTSSLAWSNIYSHNALTVVSDIRKKKDIKNSVLGLDFVNDLRSVSYRAILGQYDVVKIGEIEGPVEIGKTRNIYQTQIREGKRIHHGFLAQEVKEALKKHTEDDAALWNLEDPNDTQSGQSLRYGELIPILTKAIQELSSQVEELKRKINGS